MPSKHDLVLVPLNARIDADLPRLREAVSVAVDSVAYMPLIDAGQFELTIRPGQFAIGRQLCFTNRGDPPSSLRWFFQTAS